MQRGCDLYKASAPGRITLLGEHAVLYDYQTIVTAVNQRVTVQLTPHADDTIKIASALGSYEGKLAQIEVVKPFEFVLTILKKWSSSFKSGFTLNIQSDFSDQIGLGSSAAVTVATLAVCDAWLNWHFSQKEFIAAGTQIVRQVQGFGSGADVAASVCGGTIAFRKHPLEYESLPFDYPLTIIYSGSKKPTVLVVEEVNQTFLTMENLKNQLMQAIGECAALGTTAIRKGEWRALGKYMNIQQGLMQALRVSNPLLNALVDLLQAEPKVLGAKISGAGLGDSVIALGTINREIISPFNVLGVQQIDLNIEPCGVYCEKI